MPQSPTPAHTAQRHERVRRQHSDELAQDYVEAIHELREDTGTARVVDLTKIFGVTHVSVIRALARLEKRGLINRCPDEGIVLTDKGTEWAIASAERHTLVVHFLRGIGVSEAQANADAEGIEHHLSRESLQAMKKFLNERPGK
ncbi:transcriptional regulator [Ruficoccus amylovorans]|uniref:Transcriptional regulator MntR n=1 Tax=Ruficoccus amylovorans TaxID=1804625 RepID=A0A842HI89_9BACT|nr:iron dependent repressor, metal binding and dimerization domain protein [Ruficoccus amylovorans]MBC2595306.1 transcriptional regulator [Ruficoccus amylovorans]